MQTKNLYFLLCLMLVPLTPISLLIDLRESRHFFTLFLSILLMSLAPERASRLRCFHVSLGLLHRFLADISAFISLSGERDDD